MVLLAAIVFFVFFAINGFKFEDLGIQKIVYFTLTAWVLYYLAIYYDKKKKEKNKDKDTEK